MVFPFEATCSARRSGTESHLLLETHRQPPARMWQSRPAYLLELRGFACSQVERKKVRLWNADLSVDTLDTQALDALPVAICVTDRDGRIVRVQSARD